MFFDNSTRTKSAWAGAAARLGMQPVIVDGSSTQISHGEIAVETGAMLGMNSHALGVRHDDPTIAIMVERERLLVRCAAQRDDLAMLAQQFDGPLQFADRVVAAVDYLRRHPLVLGGAVALLALVQRRNLWSWVRRGFVVWRTFRFLDNSRFKSGI